jgi:peptidoglycan/LPS O-acetylase OafA/YrhL
MAKLEIIQILRFAAASVVLIGHAMHEEAALYPQLRAYGGIFPWPAGVDLFFVISGFIMLHVTKDGFGKPGAPGIFLLRRLKRIAPSYWAFTTLMLVAGYFSSSWVNHPAREMPHILASYAFIPWLREDGSYQPVLALGWTLNYEMFFYVLFAASLFAPRRFGVPLLIAALCGLAAAHPWVPQSWVQLTSWTRPIILEFVAGLVLAILFQRGLRIPIRLAVPMLMAAIAGFVVFGGDGPRFLAWGGPAIIACAAVALGNWRLAPVPLVRLSILAGDASYAIYLSHPFSLNLLRIAWAKAGWGAPLVYVVVASAFSVFIGIVVHLWFERPMTRWLTRKPKATPQLAGAREAGPA